jgi:hypothetical protein
MPDQPGGCLSDQVSLGGEGGCLVEEPLVGLALSLPGELYDLGRQAAVERRVVRSLFPATSARWRSL